jgi:integrase
MLRHHLIHDLLIMFPYKSPDFPVGDRLGSCGIATGTAWGTSSKMPKNRMVLTDAAVGTLPIGAIVWDARVPGLYIRRGTNRVTWSFLLERRRHGRRLTHYRQLGHWPGMSIAAARRAATVEAGKVAEGRIAPGRRSAARFVDAWGEYSQHLLQLAKRRGKPAVWHRNATNLANRLILPTWAQWSLADMSAVPAAIRDWHRDVTLGSGPIAANRAAEIMRAVYKHASRLNRHLPAALPTSAVTYNVESESQRGLAFKDFPAWREAVTRLPEPHRSFHMICLLTGARPGELARLTWAMVKPRQRLIVISGAKAGADIAIPMSSQIAAVLRGARAVAAGELVFGDCDRNGHRDRLPARGMVLRHTFKTVATDIGVDEMIVEFLMGHRPLGVSRRYVVRAMLNSGPAMRSAQRRISRRIVELMGAPAARTLYDQLMDDLSEPTN